MLPGTGPSWWLAEALASEGSPLPLPGFSGEGTADVVIVGGGYTGLWTALELCKREPSMRIALLERNICGAAASGKNGGIAHGYWTALARIAVTLGDATAVEVARAGSKAQEGLAAFAQAHADDVWWRPGGILRVATSASQERKLVTAIETIHRLGFADQVVSLTASEVQQRCSSPRFRSGAFFKEAATVHPARLARALRREALAAGVTIYEGSEVSDVVVGSVNTVVTAKGSLRAPQVVLAGGADLSSHPALRSRLTNFSSYAVMTEPAPELLRTMGWTRGEGIGDGRMFLHYFRTTADGRVLMGSGSGPISFNGRVDGPLETDPESAWRAENGLRRLLPGLATVRITHAWGGAIDVSADHLPFFGTIAGTRLHYACGFSGHGVTPTYIGGQAMASLVLEQKDEWSQSAFVTRAPSRYPPEPFRFVGGRLVRAAILSGEEADEDGRVPSLGSRIGAAIPRLLHMKVGTR